MVAEFEKVLEFFLIVTNDSFKYFIQVTFVYFEIAVFVTASLQFPLKMWYNSCHSRRNVENEIGRCFRT